MWPKSALQCGAGGLAVGWVDLDLGSSPGWWAATVATYCPSRMVEHSKSKSTQPSCQTTSPTLYVAVRPREQGAAMIIQCLTHVLSAGRRYFGRKSAFRPKGCISAESHVFRPVSAFGRNLRFKNPLFRFRPKAFRLISK